MIKVDDAVYVLDISGVDLDSLKESCYLIYSELHAKQESSSVNAYANKDAPITTKLNNSYNIFSYPYPELENLFDVIKSKFYEVEKIHYGLNLKKNYYLNAWLNYYNYNEYVDWHIHQDMKPWTWHGFFCVDTEPSKTIYHNLQHKRTYDIQSLDNRLVIGQCQNVRHKTDPWMVADRPRITVAFDVLTSSSGQDFCIPLG